MLFMLAWAKLMQLTGSEKPLVPFSPTERLQDDKLASVGEEKFH